MPVCINYRTWRRGQEPPGSAADNTEDREADEEDEEDEEDDDEDEDEEEEEQQHRHAKLRRLNDDHFIDLTHDEPMDASLASSGSTQPLTRASGRAAVSGGGSRASARSAAFNGRRAMPAVGGGGPDGPISRLSLSAHPLLPTGRAVPAPAPLPLRPRIKAEAAAVQPSAQDGLKMTLIEAVNILGPEAFRRLAACEEGSEEIGSLDRLVDLFQQVSGPLRRSRADSYSKRSDWTTYAIRG